MVFPYCRNAAVNILNVYMPRTKYSLKGKLGKKKFWIRVSTLFKFCDHFNCSPSPQKHLLHHLLCCNTVKTCTFSVGVDSAPETILVKTCFKFYQCNHYVVMIEEPQTYHLIQPIVHFPVGCAQQASRKQCPHNYQLHVDLNTELWKNCTQNTFWT